jgi:hypothetical protein
MAGVQLRSWHHIASPGGDLTTQRGIELLSQLRQMPAGNVTKVKSSRWKSTLQELKTAFSRAQGRSPLQGSISCVHKEYATRTTCTIRNRPWMLPRHCRVASSAGFFHPLHFAPCGSAGEHLCPPRTSLRRYLSHGKLHPTGTAERTCWRK